MNEADYEAMVMSCRAAIETGGECLNMARFYAADGTLLFTAGWHFLDDRRDQTAALLGQLARCFGGVRSVSVVDAWALRLEPGEIAFDEQGEAMTGVPPSEDARSREALMVLDVTAAGVQGYAQLGYGRRDDGTIIWDPKAEDLTGVTGRVADAWQRGLRGGFPLLFPSDAPRLMTQLLPLTGGVMLIAHTERVTEQMKRYLHIEGPQ